MWDHVKNPEDRFSHNEAQIQFRLLSDHLEKSCSLGLLYIPYGPNHEKTCFLHMQ